MANDMIMPGMIHVINDFNANLSSIPLSLSVYILGGSSLQLFIGPISDKYGRRITMLLGVFYFILCTIFIAFSFSIQSFFIARFLQGMGLCFITVIGYASIQEMCDEKSAIRIIALMAMISMLAPLLGPIIGGVFIEYFHWRYTFVFIAILSTISFIFLIIFMPETAHFHYTQDRRLVKKADLSVIPKLNFESFFNNYFLLLKNKKFILGSTAFSLLTVPLLCWISISPIVLENKYHLSGIAFGLAQAPLFGGVILGNLTLRKIIKYYSVNKLIIFGSSITLLGLLFSLFSTFYIKQNCWNLIIPYSFYCFGLGLVSALYSRKVLYSTLVSKGTTSAFLSIFMHLVLVAGTALMPIVYIEKNDFHFALLTSFCGIIGFICCLFFVKKIPIERLN